MKNFLLIFVIICIGAYAYTHTKYHVIRSSGAAGEVAAIAISQNNPTICNKIKKGIDFGPSPLEEELKAYCFDRTAKALKDPSVCEYISGQYLNQEDVDNCKNRVANAIKEASDTSCELPKTERDRDICYMTRVTGNGNDTLCEKITDQEVKNECYFHALLYKEYQDLNGLTKDDILLCEKISPGVRKNHCLDYFKQQYR